MLRKIMNEYFEEKDMDLFLDLVEYSIIAENNCGQYFQDYAYNYPLFTEGMQIYSGSKVSDFFSSITDILVFTIY